MKITIVLEDIQVDGGGAAVSTSINVDPKPGPDTPETHASRLANILWQTIKKEEARLTTPPPSKIVDAEGAPINMTMAVCDNCRGMFKKVFRNISTCPNCTRAANPEN